MFANVNGILCTIATVFTFDLPVPVQIAAAEVRCSAAAATAHCARSAPPPFPALKALPPPFLCTLAAG